MTAAARLALRLQVLRGELWVARWQARIWSAIAAGAVLHILVS
ncbi:MAG: hypothetical protein ABTQ30_15115 [Rhizobiaceae bacterium]